MVPEAPGSGVKEETVFTTDCVQIDSIIGLNSWLKDLKTKNGIKSKNVICKKFSKYSFKFVFLPILTLQSKTDFIFLLNLLTVFCGFFTIFILAHKKIMLLKVFKTGSDLNFITIKIKIVKH